MFRNGFRPFIDIYDQENQKIFTTYQEANKLRLEFSFWGTQSKSRSLPPPSDRNSRRDCANSFFS
jgi:hypothetical protein